MKNLIEKINLWVIIEWAATITLIIGVALTSFNIYPLNVYMSVLGNLLWLFMAVHWQKKSLMLIEVFILIIYFIGMGKHLLE